MSLSQLVDPEEICLIFKFKLEFAQKHAQQVFQQAKVKIKDNALVFCNSYSDASQKIMKNSEQVRINQLRLEYNLKPNIISSIEHISFPRLKHLVIAANKITSFENLFWIDMPNLQILNGCFNHLVHLRSFKKTNTRFVRISMYCNKLRTIQGIEQINGFALNDLVFDQNSIADTYRIVKAQRNKLKKLELADNIDCGYIRNLKRIETKELRLKQYKQYKNNPTGPAPSKILAQLFV